MKKHRILQVFLLVTVMFFVSTNAAAQEPETEIETEIIEIEVDSPFELAKGILEKKIPLTMMSAEEALIETIESNDLNKVEAEFLLGKLYLGDGEELLDIDGEVFNGDVLVDGKKAVQHLERSANSGFIPALRLLGQHYIYGSDLIKKQEVQGFKYLVLAEKGGDSEVFEDLGYCFENGIGTDQDLTLAAKYYEKAGTLDKHPQVQQK